MSLNVLGRRMKVAQEQEVGDEVDVDLMKQPLCKKGERTCTGSTVNIRRTL